MAKRDKQRKPSQPTKQPPLFPRVHELAKGWWAAPVFFLLLSIVYFAEFVFTDHVLIGTDLGSDLNRGSEPFLEKLALLIPADWSNRMGGMPMSGVRIPHYFPVRLIYPFTNYFRTVGWCYVFSMFAAGWFCYLAIRAMRGHGLAALVGGAAYASSPILLSFTLAGHEAKMLVIALFPLMLWALFRGLDTRKPIYFLALAGAIGAGIYTPHLQMLYYALWGVGFCFLWFTVARYLEDRDGRAAAVRTAMSAGALALGLGIGAMGAFPQYFYTKTESRRAGAAGEGSGLDYAQSWSLHPEEIASLVVPAFLGSDEAGRVYWGRNPFKLNYEYMGLVVLFFAAIALARIRTDGRVLPMALLALIALCFSLGPHTPVHAFFYHYVPGNSVLRTPGMIAFLFALPFCLLAGIGLTGVLEAGGDRELAKRLSVGAGIGIALLAGASAAPEAALDIWTSTFWSDIPQQRLHMAKANLPAFAGGAGIAALLVALLLGLCWLRVLDKVNAAQFALLLLPLILLDTWRYDKPFLRYADPDDQATIEESYPETIRYLRNQPGRWRVLSEAALPRDFDLAVVPDAQFTMQRYHHLTQYMNRWAWRPRGLDVMNIRYFVKAGQAQRGRDDLDVVLEADGLVVQENADYLPRFYLVPESRVVEDPEKLLEELMMPHVRPGRTALLETRPKEVSVAPVGDLSKDRIDEIVYDEKEGHIVLDVTADGPRFLVVSQNYHPYWTAALNGEERTVYRANYVWKAVQIPRGTHRVELSFEDPVAVACRWITLVCFVGWAGALGWIGLRRKD